MAELGGTALLGGAGVPMVVLDFGQGSPVLSLFPDAGTRRALTGFLFGVIGALIAVSPLGRLSGAHINPAVSFSFWLAGKVRARYALAYAGAQLLRALLGALPLLSWGSVQFGASLPGSGYSLLQATAGEMATTFAWIAGLFLFVSHRRLRTFTPLALPGA